MRTAFAPGSAGGVYAGFFDLRDFDNGMFLPYFAGAWVTSPISTVEFRLFS